VEWSEEEGAASRLTRPPPVPLVGSGPPVLHFLLSIQFFLFIYMITPSHCNEENIMIVL
jgi:hypothetical protein